MQTRATEQDTPAGLPPKDGRCIVCGQGWDAETIRNVTRAVETDRIDFTDDYFHSSCRETWQARKESWIRVTVGILQSAGLADAQVCIYSALHPVAEQGLAFYVEAKRAKGDIIFTWQGEAIEIYWSSQTFKPADESTAVQLVRLLAYVSRDMTNEEIAVELKKLDPTKPLGKELHTAGLRVFATQIAIEAVAIRNGAAGLEVLLRQRELDEPSYPGQWHCPGSFVRRGEDTKDVLRRLTERESLGEVVRAEIVDNAFIEEERGWYCGAVYLVEVKDTPEGATWFPVDDLPNPTIDHHAEILIPMAVAHFRKR